MRALVFAVFLACASAAAGAEPIELTTIDGEVSRPLDSGEGKFAAVIFITTDCPIANAYVPEMNRLAAHAKEQGGKLTLIHVDFDLTAEAAKSHRDDYDIEAPVVIDRAHEIVKATKAEITPEVVLLKPDGAVIYKGKINDLYVDFGDRRREATQHYLRDAMTAISAGKTIDVRFIEAVGCFIPTK
ncbi:MAG: hypothetical protein ACI8UO_004061 [Verrucomicrobiales bacterium]|jgi:hypothetical protein